MSTFVVVLSLSSERLLCSSRNPNRFSVALAQNLPSSAARAPKPRTLSAQVALRSHARTRVCVGTRACSPRVGATTHKCVSQALLELAPPCVIAQTLVKMVLWGRL